MKAVSNKRRTVVLTLTHKCNLNCIYCYEKHDSFSIGFENIIRIIDHEFFSKNDSDEIEFDFFGGEPFLEFELIKKL
ncbi:MAG: 4Fe-4S cluster-binding domain-containing protein [Desulfamplus sp.]|nr:4Fe-4S cluster-binding domain-containing protein [Desulfamplus sp.]